MFLLQSINYLWTWIRWRLQVITVKQYLFSKKKYLETEGMNKTTVADFSNEYQ
jgi:hypothetical protein